MLFLAVQCDKHKLVAYFGRAPTTLLSGSIQQLLRLVDRLSHGRALGGQASLKKHGISLGEGRP